MRPHSRASRRPVVAGSVYIPDVPRGNQGRSFVVIPENYPFKTYPIEIDEISVKQTGAKRGKNLVALGALVRILNIPKDATQNLAVQKFAKKGKEVLDANLKAFDSGYGAIGADFDFESFHLEATKGGAPDAVISGNQAVALGVIAAGCRYVAGYPITPATSVFEFLMEYLPNLGGTVLQFEDEIASIASCLGASFAGQKVMTPTSGPGLALMGELINLASMVELPLVIVDVQRGGPSTGLPTKTEQSDLAFAVYGAAGECPRAVIEPTTIEDCFYQTIRAFNIAEEYQMPVIVLTDQSMAMRTKNMSIPDFSTIELKERAKIGAGEAEGFARFADTPTGVSKTALPGTAGAMFLATGLEHNEIGAPNYTPLMHQKMMAKRFRKLETLAKALDNEVDNSTCELPAGAAVGIISWGATEGPIREALGFAKKEGMKVAHLQPKVLWPLPVKMIDSFIKPLKKILVFEENFTGQFATLLKTRFDIEPVVITKCQGIPFTAEEVYEAIKKNA
ncbi:MAG: 2-oxoacid:acceptor oxidoreductase subunit alpha [Chitinivibrionia bacterium]|nr:2-oxoacid:acceptor oxidoreductase subunit alpha [Chitinivibrionia bacterium]